MKYLGIMKQEHGQVTMPGEFQTIEPGQSYEVIEIGGDVLLLPSPLNQKRMARVKKLTKLSIKEHHKTLDGLAR
jgi:hypothetical protein